MNAPSSTDWSDRPVVRTDGSVEGLGRLIDAELDRVDGLLFTATPRAELAELGRTQRLKDEAFALQLRTIVKMVNAAGAAQREFAADEVALALNISPTAGAMLTRLALDAAALPGLIEAVELGRWTERHLRSVADELDYYPLSLEQRQAVVLIALARYVAETPGELRALVRRIVLRVDAVAAGQRKQAADRRRNVAIYPLGDGQGSLLATGPLEKLAEIGAALDAALDNEALVDGDDRSIDERRFDALHRIITGGSSAGAWLAVVLTPYSVTQGGELELAEIPGLGPILPQTAADLAAAAQALENHAVDAATGELLAVSDRQTSADTDTDARWAALLRAALHTDPVAAGYVASPRLKRFLEARDRTCTFAGCGRPAFRTDKDHRIPWPLGPTNRANMHCLCRRHHRAKQISFTVDIDVDGNTRWTTRSGWTFLRRPKRS
jgi:hypothetical protein